MGINVNQEQRPSAARVHWPLSGHVPTPPLAFQTKTAISEELDMGEWFDLNALKVILGITGMHVLCICSGCGVCRNGCSMP